MLIRNQYSENNMSEKAEYGSDVLNRLSRDLTDRYGKGFSHSKQG